MLPGIDDLRKKTEITCEPDATTMLDFTRSNTMNLLSIRAIQRDNCGCPGTVDSNTCSGIAQAPGTSATCSSRSPDDLPCCRRRSATILGTLAR